MRKLLLLLLIVISSVSYGQKKLDVQVGPSLFAPVTKTIDWDNKAWGQRVQLSYDCNHKYFYYTLMLGLQQSKGNRLQVPVIPSVRYKMWKGLHLGFGMGATFSNDDNARFTLAPSVSYTLKRWTVEQSLFRTTNLVQNTTDGDHVNNLGLTVYFKL